jgi:uncharacterized flavoprotein (TIGR03862 family)
VTIFDAKPSVGRKFLVAGKGGLNLTHGEELAKFVTRFSGPDQPADLWEKLLADFNPQALREWTAGLGVETFQATSGRVYPTALKAAPMLRRWIMRLHDLGVRFEMNHRCTSLTAKTPFEIGFANGAQTTADAVIFALGGGSWAKTGSDGLWQEMFAKLGIDQNSLEPANCGWEHEWPDQILQTAEGLPLKNIHVRAGETTAIGELMLTRYGLEGGAIYQLGSALRKMSKPAISIDFKPTFSHEQLIGKMQSARRNFLAEARVRWKLSEPAHAILSCKDYPTVEALARDVKHFEIPLLRPRPIDEAISSAGGIRWSELDSSLMLHRLPGVFMAGEMIDWEAPTGGYLIQGCFATGTRAANSAVNWLRQNS